MNKIDSIMGHINELEKIVDEAAFVITYDNVYSFAFRFDATTMTNPIRLYYDEGQTMLKFAARKGLLIIDSGRLVKICFGLKDGDEFPEDEELKQILKVKSIMNRGRGC